MRFFGSLTSGAKGRTLGVLVGLLGVAAAFWATPADAQEPPECRSSNPADWPDASKPYFMLVVDTSGSMLSCTNPSPVDADGIGGTACTAGDFFCFPEAGQSCPFIDTNADGIRDNVNSCGLEPTRLNDAKCALLQTVQAFGGEVNFGLSTYAAKMSGCSGGVCGDSCTAADGTCAGSVSAGMGSAGEFYSAKGCSLSPFGNPDAPDKSCGNTPNCATAPDQIFGNDWQNGGNIVVDMLQDPTWDPSSTPTSNVDNLLEWFDGQCDNSHELFAIGGTPIEGSLNTVYEYFANGWASTWQDGNYCDSGGATIDHPTPLDFAQDRPCRSLNVILVTDGAESCSGNPASAAANLFDNGVTIQGTQVPIKTYVIGFAGVDPADVDPIAQAGGTGTALIASDELELSQALSGIVSGAIQPEVCDNSDNNCNGCTDEGSKVYCNRNQNPVPYATLVANGGTAGDCCDYGGDPNVRDLCLQAYNDAAINPNGDTWWLPCWDPATSGEAPEDAWLCANPGDICDELDNNCESDITPANLATNEVDENQLKCADANGTLVCPSAEVCDSVDNDCDQIIDNALGSGTPGSICPNNCVSKGFEICDGCDDDCDGIADNGVPDIACGFSPPAQCAGTRSCTPMAVPNPGDCVAGGNTFGSCVLVGPIPLTDTCNGIDDDCDGVVDEDGGTTPCEIPGTTGLVYNDTNPLSQCVKGQQPCNGTCQGGIGPSTEICDGVDNDCDGLVDANDPDLQGTGGPCGTDNGICTKGTYQCVNGALQCVGGVQPTAEVCDGIDNDCDLLVDEAPLGDAPSDPGCWEIAGTSCPGPGGLTWDAPPGATCSSTGSLQVPCHAGTLVCSGGAWACKGSKAPSPEVCDGLDNDCDGLSDATDPDLPVGGTCGTDTGECVSGTLQCVNGTPTCTGQTPASQEVCDNLDNDCDGQVDEGTVPGAGEVCGTDTGACQTGVTACVGGVLVCQGNIAPSNEVCDGIDNDCDGAIDNVLTDAPADLGCWALPGTTCPGPGGLTWDPPPGGTCSGLGTLTSPCSAGTLVCNGTSGWVCDGGQVPSTEQCDNVDNDCDGSIDDGNPGGGGSCGQTDVGECAFGTLTCQSGSLVCIGAVNPTTEICDSLDNDCDGTPDDNVVVGVGNSCGTGTGVCEKGVTACVNGSIQCTGGVQPGQESCNGLDDDCDGLTDETSPEPLTDQPPDPGCWRYNDPATTPDTCGWDNATWDAPPGATCTGTNTLSTPCAAGTLVCSGGGWVCQGGTLPEVETCDNIDNDCDGTVDDNNPGGGGPCPNSTDVGECVAGTQVCNAGTLTCVGRVGPSVEICDGKDNDCDGQIDEASDVAGVGDTCGIDVGECQTGTTACVNGTLQCVGNIDPSPEVCDGLDNNCDGAIDNSVTDVPSDPGCWSVPGTTCPGPGGLTWDFPPGATCTGLGSLTSPCYPGQLVCDGLNGWQCQGGQLPAASETCDLVDNDCNGSVDDGNPGGGAQCGTTDVGECAFGTMTCTNGILQCIGAVTATTEVCDGLDNNCDGNVDENVPGIGLSCGVAIGKCQRGITACVSGSLVCQGGVQPDVEVCNGIDDDCDGVVDNNLTDAPADGACWNNPGTTCDYNGVVFWDPPLGANCKDLGSLTLPCSTGFLQCRGVSGWQCIGGTLPLPESCDGQDNDCNGTADDGALGGGTCGIDTGECQTGMQTCVNGTLVCSGDVGPTTESCDGLDNDCNGEIDNGIDVGGACWMMYDTALYPNDRTLGECKQGTLVCDVAGQTGQTICVGGTAPSPEVCDGKDNDCDGQIDETGAAPDGIDGTADPFDSTRVIGASCGSDIGECTPGQYACLNGQVVCAGEVGPSTEICDCKDNDCDGQTDEDPAGTEPVLCGTGTTCVAVACTCAAPCGGGEFACPTGLECQSLAKSSDPTGPTSRYCIDPNKICDQCEMRTYADATGDVECGPAGTTTSDGQPVPECVCAGTDVGCRGPCYNKTCPSGEQCVLYGDAAGECRSSTDCRFFGCPDGQACHDTSGTGSGPYSCVDDPCDPNTCADVCKPSTDFSMAECVGSCADVTCNAGEICTDGTCQATGCNVDCMAGEYCQDQGGATFACGQSKCTVDMCQGAYCDPLTGLCADDPCEAVKCPMGQVCSNGECVSGTDGGTGGTGGNGGVAGTGGTTGTDGGLEGGTTGGAGGNGGKTNKDDNEAVIGLATGGGGCRCEMPAQRSSSRGAWLLALAAIGATAVRRRARREGGAR